MPKRKMFISPATMPERSAGRNRVRGTGNISGRWTIEHFEVLSGGAAARTSSALMSVADPSTQKPR